MKRATAFGLPILVLTGFSAGWIGARLTRPPAPPAAPVAIVVTATPAPIVTPDTAAASVSPRVAIASVSIPPHIAGIARSQPRKRRKPRRLPPGADAYVPPAISATGAATVVVNRLEHRLYLYQEGQIVRAFRVATGKYRNSTPSGTFRIISKARNPDWTYKGKFVPGGTPANPLGHWWMGLSVTHRDSGIRFGIHGTNAPWLIGQSVSRGCIRMRNRDAAALFRLVSAGTPVVIY